MKQKSLMLLALLGVIAAFSGTVNAGLTDGLVAYWPFDNNAEDVIGDNDGTLMGNASYVDGKLGKAVSTSNEDTVDYVQFDTTSDGLTGDWTVATWMYAHNQLVGGFIDGYFGDPGVDDCYGLRLPGAFDQGAALLPHPGMVDYVNNINATWDGEDSQTQAYETPLNTWTLLVFVGSDTQCELFADGVSQGTMVYAETMGTHGSDEEGDPMQFKLTWDRLGNMVKYSSYGDAMADYDELAIWDRNLTYEEIQVLWNSGQGTQVLLPSDPSPRYGENVLINANLELSWANMEPNNPGDPVFVEVLFGTEPNEQHPGYDMEPPRVLDPVSGMNVTSVEVDVSLLDTYYWQVNSWIYGADKLDDENMIEGALWLFHAVDDVPPTVKIDTLDQMTWSGEGVPIDANVLDDDESEMTIVWTADAASLADPNLIINIVPHVDPKNPDATVTITKTVDTGDVVTVTMTVTVSDLAHPTEPDTASIEIDVYDDACVMAKNGEGVSVNRTDINANCITGLEDLVEMLAAWLDDYSAKGQADRP